MGKLKALKGFGKAYEAFKKTVTAPETRTRNIESGKMFEKAKIKKEPSKVEKALKDFRNYFKEAEKTPEMKAYRKEQNFPKPKYF
jgi:2-keto-4-pentenoate hydratase/2-oxohepta-3-ene-1,7-dioic acid hydratase in catechol pathway